MVKDRVMVLRDTFKELCSRYTRGLSLAETYWQELTTAYTSKHRYYHNLHHLHHLLAELQPVQHLIEDWDVVLFSLFYHDAVYNASKSNNEEKSAELAAERMAELGVSNSQVAKCSAMILATKGHTISPDSDTNYFTDADLAILGATPAAYAEYARQVRKEYSIYPDVLYRPGRRKVLQHFLSMERIYKTQHFYHLYEATARNNMRMEIEGGV